MRLSRRLEGGRIHLILMILIAGKTGSYPRPIDPASGVVREQPENWAVRHRY